jgi:hypothetical protein
VISYGLAGDGSGAGKLLVVWRGREVCFRAAAFKDAERVKSALGVEENEDEANWINDCGVAGEWDDLRGAGCGTVGASGESGDDDGEEPIDALREKYGGGGGFDASGEVRFQTHGGDEFVRARGDAHRAIELFFVREDFGADGTGVQADGRGW